MFDDKDITTRKDVETKLREIVTAQLGLDNNVVTLDSRFEEDLGADSLDFIEIVMEIEEQFDLPGIPDDDAEQLETFHKALDYICEKLSIHG